MGENEARDSNAHRASAATSTCDMNWSREQVAASPSRGRVCDRGIRYFCLAPSLQNQPKGTISIVRSLFLACCERLANAVSEGVANMPCRPGRLCQTRYGQLRQASVGVSGARNSIKHQKSLAQGDSCLLSVQPAYTALEIALRGPCHGHFRSSAALLAPYFCLSLSRPSVSLPHVLSRFTFSSIPHDGQNTSTLPTQTHLN